MIKLLSSLLILLINQIAFSSDNNIFTELQEVRDKEIERIIEARKYSQNRRYTDTELFTLKVTLEEIIKSELKPAFIKRGSILIELSSGDEKYSPKGLSVKAYTKLDQDGYRYIVDKQNVPRYKIAVDSITDVTEVTDLYREPEKFVRLEKKAPKNVYDKSLKYNIDFNFHTGLSLTQFTKSIIQDAGDYAPLLRLELTLSSNFDLPVDTGLAIVYEGVSGTIENGGGTFSSRTLSFGPNFIFKKVLASYDLKLQPRLAVLADLNEIRGDETITHKLSDTSLLFALEKEIKWASVGVFNLGYSFQRKWLKPKAKSQGLNFSTNAESDDSFAVYIGHGTDLTW